MTRRKLDAVVTDLGVVHINLLKELNNIRTVKIIRLALKVSGLDLHPQNCDSM